MKIQNEHGQVHTVPKHLHKKVKHMLKHGDHAGVSAMMSNMDPDQDNDSGQSDNDNDMMRAGGKLKRKKGVKSALLSTRSGPPEDFAGADSPGDVMADGGQPGGVQINAEHNELIVDPKNDKVLMDLKNLPPHPEDKSKINPAGTLNLPEQFVNKMVIPKKGVDGREAFLAAKAQNNKPALNRIYRNLQNKQQAKELGEQADSMDMVKGEGGSIHINPANKGKFNALKKRTGKSTEELTHSSNPLTRKRAVFAQNARKWKHEDGGTVGGYDVMKSGGMLKQPKRYDQNSVIAPGEYDWNISGAPSYDKTMFDPNAEITPVTMDQLDKRPISTNPVNAADFSSKKPYVTKNPYARTPGQNAKDFAISNMGNFAELATSFKKDDNSIINDPLQAQGLKTLANRKYSIDADLGANQRDYNTGNYFMKNYGGASSNGQFKDFLKTNLVNKMNANAKEYDVANNANNAYAGEYGQAQLNAGVQNRAEGVRVQEDNLANRSKRQDMRINAISKIGENYQKQQNDNTRLSLLPTMFPSMSPEDISKWMTTWGMDKYKTTVKSH